MTSSQRPSRGLSLTAPLLQEQNGDKIDSMFPRLTTQNSDADLTTDVKSAQSPMETESFSVDLWGYLGLPAESFEEELQTLRGARSFTDSQRVHVTFITAIASVVLNVILYYFSFKAAGVKLSDLAGFDWCFVVLTILAAVLPSMCLWLLRGIHYHISMSLIATTFLIMCAISTAPLVLMNNAALFDDYKTGYWIIVTIITVLNAFPLFLWFYLSYSHLSLFISKHTEIQYRTKDLNISEFLISFRRETTRIAISQQFIVLYCGVGLALIVTWGLVLKLQDDNGYDLADLVLPTLIYSAIPLLLCLLPTYVCTNKAQKLVKQQLDHALQVKSTTKSELTFLIMIEQCFYVKIFGLDVSNTMMVDVAISGASLLYAMFS